VVLRLEAAHTSTLGGYACIHICMYIIIIIFVVYIYTHSTHMNIICVFVYTKFEFVYDSVILESAREAERLTLHLEEACVYVCIQNLC
jgi:hypothetical protein